jgi:signal transduction histidine kinase
MTLVMAESGRHYNQSDLAFAEEVANRAALAVDNARLYGRAKGAIAEREDALRLRDEFLKREQAARHEAEAANRMKDEFLATVSHELRTPLNAILGWSHMLQHNRFDEATSARALETIERNAKSQTQLIEDILDVSRIITGKLRLDVQPVELAPVVEAAIHSVRPAADAKEIRLEAILDPRAGPISGDPSRLQQIVWNLVSNAVKFTPKGGRVQVRLERVNSHVEIIVSDTGEGISKEFLPHVFDRFRQADATSTRRHGGLGLGLAIVRHLAEMHGGTVEAESDGEGCGATFIVKLPLIVAHAERFNLERAHPVSGRGIPLTDGPRLDGIRVMVIDDDRDARDLLETILKQFGAEVETFQSSREAINQFDERKPDVIVSDIEMPEQDGYDFIRALREIEAARHTPAVALTAYARTEDRLRALSAGYQIHIAKPVEPVELAVVISSLVKRSGKGV